VGDDGMDGQSRSLPSKRSLPSHRRAALRRPKEGVVDRWTECNG
jgi:hypothetical protein